MLIAGGSIDNTGVGIATAEIYDPVHGTWTPTASISHARGSHTAVLLASGNVLVAGGADTNNGGLATAELYDPRSGTWHAAGSLLTPRWGHRASLLNDGRVLAVGGCCGPSDLTSSEIYDAASSSWSPTGSTAVQRSEGFSLAGLADGSLLIAGGGTAAVERYDPAGGLWSMTGSMGTDRDYTAVSVLADGRVFVAGGSGWICDPDPDIGCMPTDLASAEVYEP